MSKTTFEPGQVDNLLRWVSGYAAAACHIVIMIPAFSHHQVLKFSTVSSSVISYKYDLPTSHKNSSCPVSAHFSPTTGAFVCTSTRNLVLSTGLNVSLCIKGPRSHKNFIYGGKGRLPQKDPETLPYQSRQRSKPR